MALDKSKNSNCVPLKGGRKLHCRFWNFAIGAVSSIILSFISVSILSATPQYKEAENKLYSIEQERVGLIVDSRLGEKNENGQLKGQSEIIENYVLSLEKASLALYSSEACQNALSSIIYEKYDPIDENRDNCYSYYVNFKKTNQDSFDEVGSFGEEFYLASLKEGDLSSYFVEEGYPFLKEEIALKLDEGIRFTAYKEGRTIYSNLKERYGSLLSKGEKEFEAHYIPYLENGKVYSKAYKDTASLYIIAFLFASTLSWGLFYLLLPSLFKGPTLTERLFKADRINNNGSVLPFWKSLLHALFNLLLVPSFASTGMLVASPLTGIEILFNLNLLGIHPFFYVLIGLILVLLDWMGFIFFKERKETFMEKALSFYSVDTREVELKKDGE